MSEADFYCTCGVTKNLERIRRLVPDVVQGHGKAVDWWAFGVLVYEMLAGYPPFYDEDTTQTYQRILHGRFNFPADFPVTARCNCKLAGSDPIINPGR